MIAALGGNGGGSTGVVVGDRNALVAAVEARAAEVLRDLPRLPEELVRVAFRWVCR